MSTILENCTNPLDVMHANENHKLITQIFQIAAEYGGDAAEIISAFLPSSIPLQKSILRMMSNYYNDSNITDFKDEVTETFNKLAEDHLEVIMGAANAGYFEELEKINSINSSALSKADEYAGEDALGSSILAYAIDLVGAHEMPIAPFPPIPAFAFAFEDAPMLGEYGYVA